MPQREVNLSDQGLLQTKYKMRTLGLALIGGVALLASACGSPSATNSTNGTANNLSSRTAATPGLPPVSSAHGGISTGTPPAAATGNAAARPGIDTAVLDARIEKAEVKAKATGASQADKLAAAAALLERGNIYRDAGQPALYKFALGDYRRALRFQPDNAEARGKMNEIVSIYQSMGRPVPENGNEP